MWSRNLINNFDLIRSDQIRSNDQVRSDQRSDRTGNSTKFDRNSNQAEQSVIVKMDQEIWSRNLNKKCEQEIWSRIPNWWHPTRSYQMIRSDQTRDEIGQEIWPTSVKSHSKFARILMAFRSNLDRMWIDFQLISMQFAAIWVSGASEIDRKSVPVPSLGTPGRPKECPGHPRAPQGVLRNHILIEIQPIANQIWSKLDRLWCEISTE